MLGSGIVNKLTQHVHTYRRPRFRNLTRHTSELAEYAEFHLWTESDGGTTSP